MKEEYTIDRRYFESLLQTNLVDVTGPLMELTKVYLDAKKVLSQQEFETLLCELDFDGCNTEQMFLGTVIEDIVSLCEGGR